MGNRTADEILDQLIGKKKKFWGRSQQFIYRFLILLDMEFNINVPLSPQNGITRNELARSLAGKTKNLAEQETKMETKHLSISFSYFPKP